MPRDRKTVEAGLEKKGFVQSDNDHHYFTYHTLRTEIPCLHQNQPRHEGVIR